MPVHIGKRTRVIERKDPRVDTIKKDHESLRLTIDGHSEKMAEVATQADIESLRKYQCELSSRHEESVKAAKEHANGAYENCEKLIDLWKEEISRNDRCNADFHNMLEKALMTETFHTYERYIDRRIETLENAPKSEAPKKEKDSQTALYVGIAVALLSNAFLWAIK